MRRLSFARKGFSGSSVRDITDRAEVTRGNFYYYFPDKTGRCSSNSER